MNVVDLHKALSQNYIYYQDENIFGQSYLRYMYLSFTVPMLQSLFNIIYLLSLLMNHLVIGQHRKAPNFSAFHLSPHGSLVSIGQHFVTTRVVHLPKRTETSLITESD